MNKSEVVKNFRVWIGFLMLALIACSSSDKKDNYLTELNDISTNGVVSAYVIDLKTNQSIVDFNEGKRLIPASLTKVFTTAAAYDLLGSDFRFSTKFYLAQSKNSTATSLIIHGGGDPTLGSDRWDVTNEDYLFKKIKEALRSNKTKVLKDIVIDDYLFSGISYPSKRIWEDMANYYGAPPSSLTYKENTFRLTLASPNEVGALCKVVKCEPTVDKQLKCLVRSSSVNKDSAYIYGHPDMSQWYVSGSIPAGRSSFVIKGALPNPSKTLATRLKSYLTANGIKVLGDIRKDKSDHFENKKELYTHQSPNLDEIIRVINKKSFNLFADHVFFQLAIEQNKKANWDNASGVLQSYWNEKIDGFSGVFYDGSGLSPFNRFSAKDMVNALAYVDGQEYADYFMTSLSEAGKDGTLKYLFKDEVIEGSFVGKSGSMNNVLGYCGYLTTQSGNKYAVCIMVNGFTESFAKVRQQIARVLISMMQNQ